MEPMAVVENLQREDVVEEDHNTGCGSRKGGASKARANRAQAILYARGNLAGSPPPWVEGGRVKVNSV
jgi:hypothetical protein